MPHRPTHLLRRAAVLAVGLAALLPAAASAAECAPERTSTLFSSLGDQHQYFLAPGGDFESWTSSWSRSGDTGTDWRADLLSFGGLRAFELEGAGASITSPAFCVDELRPHLRLLADTYRGYGQLRVEAVVDGVPSVLATLDGGAYRDWSASAFVPLSTALNVVTGTVHDVRLRMTVLSGTWRVDTVAIDPRAR